MGLMHRLKWWLLTRFVPAPLYLRLLYRRLTGKRLDLRHPRTLNEKMQWLKLHDRNPVYPVISDKLRVRLHVKEKIGEQYLIPLLRTYDHPSEIEVADLPPFPFVLKTNHDSGGVVIVRQPDALDWPAAMGKLRRHFDNNHYWATKEWGYRDIPKKILCEQLLLDSMGRIPNDYKFNCFSGRVEFIYVSIDREDRNYRRIYDRNWAPMGMTWAPRGKSHSKFDGPDIDPPPNLDEMIDVAERLARDFDYIRIDLYHTGGRIYFGEITQYHGSGFELILPEALDLHYGSLVRHPSSLP
jgi:hypothetical protein